VHNCRINKTILNVFLIENLSTSSRRRQSNKVFFFPSCCCRFSFHQEMPFLCAHTNIQNIKSSSLVVFFAYIAQGGFVGGLERGAKKGKRKFSPLSIFQSQFFLLFSLLLLLYHFIYTFSKKKDCTSEGNELSEMIGASE
jgi:hypothetical protein